MRALLNPLRHGLFAFQLWSHKLLRYLSFAPLAVSLVLGFWLAHRGGVYALIAAGQVTVLVLAWVGWRRGEAGGGLRKLSLYFVLVNIASALAAGKFVKGERIVVWNPRVG